MLTPINGILFINLLPVTTFAISILSGYNMSTLEVTGAFMTIAALVSNNLYQRKLIRTKSAIPAACRRQTARRDEAACWMRLSDRVPSNGECFVL